MYFVITIASAAVGLLISYYLIKAAVCNGILEAERRKSQVQNTAVPTPGPVEATSPAKSAPGAKPAITRPPEGNWACNCGGINPDGSNVCGSCSKARMVCEVTFGDS